MSVKLMFMTSTFIILSILLGLLPSAIRGVQPTAEFVLLVVAPVLWNYVSTRITAPFLYVLLNIVLVTLGFSSPTPPTSKDDQPHNSGLSAQIESIETRSDAHIDQNNIIVESKLGDPVEKILSPAASPDQVQKPTAPLIMERRSSSFKDLKATLMPAPALYNKESRLRRSTVNLSNLSRESRGSREIIITESCTPTAPKRSVPQLVVFEISSDMGNQAHLNDDITVTEGDEETEISHREEEGKALSADELFVKAESFIKDFYRQLKMQREDSWNRLIQPSMKPPSCINPVASSLKTSTPHHTSISNPTKITLEKCHWSVKPVSPLSNRLKYGAGSNADNPTNYWCDMTME